MISATHRSGRSSSAGNGMPECASMPIGVALMIPSAWATAPGRSAPALARPAPKWLDRFCATLSARFGSMSTIVSSLTPSMSAACATAAPERLGGGRPVRVLADLLAVSQDHGVHGTKRPRVLGEFIEVGNDRLLAGMGDVEAVEAHALR